MQETISYSLRCRYGDTYMLTRGSQLYTSKPQIVIFSKREIAPQFLDEYCVIDAKNDSEQLRLSPFGKEALVSMDTDSMHHYIAKIEMQIEFVCSSEVLDALHQQYVQVYDYSTSLDLFSNQTSGFLVVLRVFAIADSIPERLFTKGRLGAASVMRLYEADKPTSVKVASLAPVLNQGRFEYIISEILHTLRVKDALIAVFKSTQEGKESLELIRKTRREIEHRQVYVDSERIVDRSQTDYDQLYSKALEKYPNMATVIDQIRNTIPAQWGEIAVTLKATINNEIESRNRLMAVHMRSVLRIAFWYHEKYGVDLEDAFQEGMAGLLTAVSHYSEHTGTKFSSYASFWVRQVIQRNLVTTDSLVYFPVHVMDKILPVRCCVIEEGCYACERLCVCPRILDCVATTCNIDNKQASNLIQYTLPIKPFHIPCIAPDVEQREYSDHGVCIANSDERIDREKNTEFAHNLLAGLKPREQDVICKRYGIGYEREMTLAEVGETLNVTRERVRQIEASAMRSFPYMQLYREYKKAKRQSKHKTVKAKQPKTQKTIKRQELPKDEDDLLYYMLYDNKGGKRRGR